MDAAALSTPSSKQCVSGVTSSFLYSGYRLLCRPVENFMPDRPRREPATHKADFRAALWAQSMIDCQCADVSAALARPTIGQNREGETIGAARNCDGEKRAGLEAGEQAEGGGKLGEA